MSGDRKKALKKLARLRKKELKPQPEEARRIPVYLSFEDADLLEYLLTLYDPAHRLIKKLLENQTAHLDEMARLHEIVAREKSHAWWERPEDWVEKELESSRKAYMARAKKHAQAVDNIRKVRGQGPDGQPDRRRKKQLEIASPPPEELRDELEVTGLVDLPSDVVEQLVDLGNTESQHPGGAGPAVPGDEAQDVEVRQGDGSGDGSLA